MFEFDVLNQTSITDFDNIQTKMLKKAFKDYKKELKDLKEFNNEIGDLYYDGILINKEIVSDKYIRIVSHIKKEIAYYKEVSNYRSVIRQCENWCTQYIKDNFLT